VESLSRPTPTSSSSDQVRAWIEWFGLTRLVMSALAVVVVGAGVFWLVRTPPPPTEASLPRAIASTVPVSPAVVEPDAKDLGAQGTTVHVAGAVDRPGVYQLDADARVKDAIEAAGGVVEGANPDALNLAAPVADGTRVYVPVVGEDVPAVYGQSETAAEKVPTIVNVNRANERELEELPGVGPATAAAIVAEREQGGPFVDADDLQRVPGIGPAKLDLLRGLVAT